MSSDVCLRLLRTQESASILMKENRNVVGLELRLFLALRETLSVFSLIFCCLCLMWALTVIWICAFFSSLVGRGSNQISFFLEAVHIEIGENDSFLVVSICWSVLILLRGSTSSRFLVGLGGSCPRNSSAMLEVASPHISETFETSFAMASKFVSMPARRMHQTLHNVRAHVSKGRVEPVN